MQEENTWQSKHVWLIVIRQAAAHERWHALFALRDLAEAIPIISDNALPLLAENNFQTPPLDLDPRF